MPAASCISAEAPRSQLGRFLLFQIKNLNFLKTEAAGLWLQTPELEFGNVFSTLPPLYPCINAIGALLLSLDTLTVTVDNTAESLFSWSPASLHLKPLHPHQHLTVPHLQRLLRYSLIHEIRPDFVLVL